MEEDKREAPASTGDTPTEVSEATSTEAPVTGNGSAGAVDVLFPPEGAADTDAGASGDTLVASSAPPAGAQPAGRPVKASVKGRGGTAGIFAGVAVIAPVLIQELVLGSEPFLLLPVTMIVLAVALSGFRVVQGGRDGTIGRIGLLVASAGAAVLTVMFAIMAYQDIVLNTRLQSGIGVLQLGFFLLLGGILILGSASLVAGVISRGPMLLLMVSLVLGVVLDAIGAFPGLRFRWGPVSLGQGMHYGLKIFGLSLIWLGYSILKDSKAQAAAVARSA
ncbi:MAG TPA: hypothetical protein VHJ78_07130 [Actinomycetota bacterium]|nr:hypothetical protein [Actinomycetota bacterium]